MRAFGFDAQVGFLYISSVDCCVRIDYDNFIVWLGWYWHGAVNQIFCLSGDFAIYDCDCYWNIMRRCVDGNKSVPYKKNFSFGRTI